MHCLSVDFPSPSDFQFVYRITDPPELLEVSESKSVLESPPISPSEDFAKRLLRGARGLSFESTETTQTDEMATPQGLETAHSDWIGLYPADFRDVSKDYVSYVYAPTSASDNGEYRGKFPNRNLADLVGMPLQLIYMSKTKNCPQGYSPIFSVSTE